MIKKINLKNKDEFLSVINLIYKTFLSCNAQDSSEKLKEKMKRLFWSNTLNKEVTELFEKTDIVLISKDNWIINWVIRWNKDKIINLYIDPNTQWKGIWKKLINKYIQEAKKLWSQSIYLKPSKYAYNFYIKYGFKPKDDKYLEIHI